MKSGAQSRAPWNLSTAVAVFVLHVLLVSLVAAALSPPNPPWQVGIVSSVSLASLSLAVVVLETNRPSIRTVAHHLRALRRPSLWYAIAPISGVVIALVLFLARSTAVVSARPLGGPGPSTLDVLWLVILDPTASEIYFRGLLQLSLNDFLGNRLGLALTALAFAAAHLPGGRTDIAHFSAILALGLILGITMERQDLGACFLGHASYNATQMFIQSL